MKSIQEAHRYLTNAKEILRDKSKKEDRIYKDKNMLGLRAYCIFRCIDGSGWAFKYQYDENLSVIIANEGLIEAGHIVDCVETKLAIHY